MVFVTGGNSQGKLDFVKSEYGFSDGNVSDGASCDIENAFDRPVLNRLHSLVRRMMKKNIKPDEAIFKGIKENPQIVVICDEIGCGIVPISADERAFREETGRISCMVAKKAEKVYRVCCGIPTLIKGA